MRYILTLLGICSLVACAQAPKKQSKESLDAWIAEQEKISWGHLLETISPKEPKVPGGPVPVKGIVVGALSRKDPDYYFHWVRDSSNVMRTVVEVFAAGRPYVQPDQLVPLMTNYLELTKKLQKDPSPYRLGEPRYTTEGKADTLPWSRPQFDGPALRALAVLEYLKLLDRKDFQAQAKLKPLALDILKTDLDFVASVWKERGFDLWEELKADNYHTRLVQLSALEKSSDYLESKGLLKDRISRYRQAARGLSSALDDHWDPTRNFVRSQLAIVATDGYTAKQSDLDSAVVVAVMEASRDKEGHSVMDDRVQATVATLEELFKSTYPINKRDDIGLGYGRYRGDVYYGGNPWYLITAYYAKFYYQLAQKMRDGAPFKLTKKNFEFVKNAMPEIENQLKPEFEIPPHIVLHSELSTAFQRKGDQIMKRIQAHMPADGQFYEQFDKNTGKPGSSRGIGWAHTSFIATVLERGHQ